MHESSHLPIRADLTTAHARAWSRIGQPGTWLDAATRVAVAEEVRNAPVCRLCQQRKGSLSPYGDGAAGVHDHLGGLPEALVEVVHRVRTDAPRLREAWLAELLEGGLEEGAYVEAVAVLATVVAVDSFADALGIDRPALPAPSPGAATRVRPTGAKRQLAWVSTVAPEDVTPADGDPYAGLGGVHIHQALSLVPAEVRAFFALDAAQYLPDAALRDYAHEYRALTHPQIELLAARVSALNQCLY